MSLRSLVIAVGMLIGLAVPTAASAAYATGDVHLRVGPGVQYRIITTVPRGAYVRVLSCVPGWCRAVFHSTVGWMSSSYIGARTPRYYRPAPPPPRYYRYYYPRPYPYYYYQRPYRYPYRYYGYRSPSFGFYYYGH